MTSITHAEQIEMSEFYRRLRPLLLLLIIMGDCMHVGAGFLLVISSISIFARKILMHLCRLLMRGNGFSERH